MVTREKGGRGKEAREKKGSLNNRKIKGKKPRKQEVGAGYAIYGRLGEGLDLLSPRPALTKRCQNECLAS